MPKLLYIDFETFSDVPLKSRGAYIYMRGAFWEPLLCAYRWEGEEKTTLLAGYDAIVNFVRAAHDDEEVTFVAHNANFERNVISTICRYPYGSYVPPERFIDTMAMCTSLGFPASLEQAAIALGVEEKDSAGTRLINMFCQPNKKGVWCTPESHPEDWKRFGDYAVQDVDTMVQIHQTLEERFGGFPEGEREVWNADQRINDRGILADVELAAQCVKLCETIKTDTLADMAAIAGIENANSQKQLLEWLVSQLEPVGVIERHGEEYVYVEDGELFKSIDKAAVQKILTLPGVPPLVKNVLDLRTNTNAASVAKFNAYLRFADPLQHRVRGAMQFFGAHTGRWAGRGVQFQNLPKASTGGEEETNALVARAMDGDDTLTLEDMKPLIRACVIAPEGKNLTVCDYSAIEARVIAWLAGEDWVLDAFRAGRDIYIETASRMFHVSYEEARALRQKGKVAVLALGYNGGVGALRKMGGEGTDEELQELVYAWRNANPNIARFWKELEGAFRKGYGKVGQFITVQAGRNGSRRIVLPSGRAVYYHKVHTRPMLKFGKTLDILHFYNPKAKKPKVMRPGQEFDPYLSTYGGKLTENITQAVARDVLAHALVNLEKYGAEVVAHVHDEVICQSGLPVERVAELMGAGGSEFAPAWSEGLPLAAEGYNCSRYRKE